MVQEVFPHSLTEDNNLVRVFNSVLLALLDVPLSKATPFCSIPIQPMDGDYNLLMKKVRDKRKKGGAFCVDMDDVEVGERGG